MSSLSQTFGNLANDLEFDPMLEAHDEFSSHTDSESPESGTSTPYRNEEGPSAWGPTSSEEDEEGFPGTTLECARDGLAQSLPVEDSGMWCNSPPSLAPVFEWARSMPISEPMHAARSNARPAPETEPKPKRHKQVSPPVGSPMKEDMRRCSGCHTPRKLSDFDGHKTCRRCFADRAKTRDRKAKNGAGKSPRKARKHGATASARPAELPHTFRNISSTTSPLMPSCFTTSPLPSFPASLLVPRDEMSFCLGSPLEGESILEDARRGTISSATSAPTFSVDDSEPVPALVEIPLPAGEPSLMRLLYTQPSHGALARLLPSPAHAGQNMVPHSQLAFEFPTYEEQPAFVTGWMPVMPAEMEIAA